MPIDAEMSSIEDRVPATGYSGVLKHRVGGKLALDATGASGTDMTRIIGVEDEDSEGSVPVLSASIG